MSDRAGERLIRVPPKLMGQSRHGERRPGKSDDIDAVAVARAALREDVESLPTAWSDPAAMEIRLLADHRDDLVAERTRVQNRLRWHLAELDADLEAALPAGALDRTVWLDRKLAEGKIKTEAYRCLKRHLARRIWHVPCAPTAQASENENITTFNNANAPATTLALTEEHPGAGRRAAGDAAGGRARAGVRRLRGPRAHGRGRVRQRPAGAEL